MLDERYEEGEWGVEGWVCVRNQTTKYFSENNNYKRVELLKSKRSWREREGGKKRNEKGESKKKKGSKGNEKEKVVEKGFENVKGRFFSTTTPLFFFFTFLPLGLCSPI